MSKTRQETELAAEREHIAFLYRELDAERARAHAELAARLRDSADTAEEARWAREVAVQSLRSRVNRLGVADNGLCFGRTWDTGGGTAYIGRIGLFAEEDDYEPLLTDWRAPAARPFYCATAATPEGLTARRHFRTGGNRRVLDFHDEALAAGDGAGDPDSALLTALNAPRAEVMRDIVATIQAEQDRIIRLAHAGVVVIEGGPGTGKTAVALHRVAYLLYHQRDRLARRGVLLIGPNPGFLRYVGQVLPSLGETDVVFATPGELMPGVRATGEDDPVTRRLKGSAEMVGVLRRAIADRESAPAEDEPILIELDDVTVALDTALADHARWRARADRLKHNEAVGVFRAALIEQLAERAVVEIGRGWLNSREGDTAGLTEQLIEDVRAELTTSGQLDAAVHRLWPVLTAQQLLAGLLSSADRIGVAAAGLAEADRAALHRPVGNAWTGSDVPLLDEAAELLGRDDSAERAAERRRERIRREYAEGVLEILDTEEDPDGEVLRAVDLLDSTAMAERQEELDTRYLAERAAADREWTYGHVVVDEAQELSAMDWRVLMRRCPSRSMTVVGDLAQRQSAAGARSWKDVLEPFVPDRWAYQPLSVNYRTPVEVMAVAADVLAAVDPAAKPPESVRSTGVAPWARRVPAAELGAAATAAVLAELAGLGEGSAAILVPEGHPLLTAPVTTARPAAVLTARQAKGLEFDVVVLLEPAAVVATDPQGLAALYVALTRTTQRLGVLHTGDLPAVLDRLAAPGV